MKWPIGSTRTFEYLPRRKDVPQDAIVHGFNCHHDTHSILIEHAPLAPTGEAEREGPAMPSAPALAASRSSRVPRLATSCCDPYRKGSA